MGLLNWIPGEMIMRFFCLCLLLSSTSLGKNKNKQLLNAVLTNEVTAAQKLLEAGANPNYRLKGGETLLMGAAEHGFVDVMQVLLEKGANPGHTSRREGNAATKAVRKRRIGALKVLITNGIDLNAADSDGRTPLMMAVKQSDYPMASILLGAGANIDERDDQGNTALLHAVKNTRLSMVALLLKHGADYNLKDKQGNHPFGYVHFLRSTKLADLFNRFMEQGTLAETVTEKNLHTAAEDGDLALIDTFIRQGVDVNDTDEAGETALMKAVKEGRTETVEHLLSHGADPNIYNKEGSTALAKAVSREDEAVFVVLAQNGAESLYFQDGAPTRAPIEKRDMQALKKILQKWKSKGRPAPKSKPTGVPRLGQAGVTPPVFTRRYAPKYPGGGVQGYVILECTLDPNGTIHDIRVLKGLDDWRRGFEYEAIKALKRWEYKPGTVDGKPSPIRMTLKIEFVLQI